MSAVKKATFSIKSFFVHTDEEETIEETVEEAPQKQATIKKTTSNVVLDQTKVEEYIKQLMSSIESGNIEGFDYIEFRSATQDMEAAGMSIDNAYLAAFTTAKTIKNSKGGAIDKKFLADSAKYYLTILNDESKLFESSVESTYQLTVGDVDTEITQMQADLDANTTKIEALTKENTGLAKSIDKKTESIKDKKLDIDKAKRAFVKAKELVQNEINADIKNINTYIK